MDASQDQTPIMTPPPEAENAPLKHSGPGIASFIVGLLSILTSIMSILVIIIGIADYITEGGINIPDQDELAADTAVLTGVLLFFLGLLLSVAGVVLGIIGCVIRNRRRVFPIFGLVLSGMVLFGTVGFFVLGLIAQSQ